MEKTRDMEEIPRLLRAGGNVNNDNNGFGYAPGGTVYYVFMS
jgi:hypothetical protein